MFQNLQIVGSTHGNVLGEEVDTPLPLFPFKAPHTVTLSGCFAVWTVYLSSYLDDPGGLLTNLEPPLTSLKVLSSENIICFQSSDVQCTYFLQN